jgi:excinuclease UvrABC nuclease subunit
MGRKVDDAHLDALKLLRSVRDSAHAVALGAHRSLRREERLNAFA